MKSQITKRIFIQLFIVAFAISSIMSVHSTANAVNEIAVGVILPLSGSLAPIGNTCKQGLEIAQKEVNREGGIKALGGAKIKLVFADSRGDPKIGLSEAERLIVKDKVSALYGAFQSSVTLTSTQVAEKYQVPYLAAMCVSDVVTGRGYKYVFRANETSSLTARETVKFVDGMSKMSGKPVKTLGFLYENSENGQRTSSYWHKYAKEYGFEVILDESYPTTITDIAPSIIKFKDKNPDVVLGTNYISDIILIVKTMAEYKWWPKALVGSGGGEIEPEFVEAVGDLSEYMFTNQPFATDALLTEKYSWARKMTEEYKKDYKVEFSANSGEAYGIFYVLLAAIERAKSPGRQEIRDALAKLIITEESAKTNILHRRALLLPYEKIEFGPDGQNLYVRLPIVQFQKRVLKTVYPKDLVLPGVKAIWPTPSWEERSKTQ